MSGNDHPLAGSMRASGDEARLVRRAQRGSRDAASILFERYWGTVWTVAYATTGSRDLADDIAQETFIRAFGAIGRFDPRRPLAPWLKRIAANRALDELRRERHSSGIDAAYEEVEFPELDYSVVDAVKAMDPDHRILIVLRYWLDWSVADIATALELPEGTVMSRLARSRDSLRVELGVRNA